MKTYYAFLQSSKNVLTGILRQCKTKRKTQTQMYSSVTFFKMMPSGPHKSHYKCPIASFWLNGKKLVFELY
jgi:hypothetical protein